MDVKKWRGKTVLEIGCGSGSDLVSFAKAGAIVSGLDVTEKAIKMTQSRLKLHGFGKYAPSVYPYNGKFLPYADGYFDLIYSYGVLHHTPYMDDLLAEISRCLRPGGTFKAMLYHKYSLLYYYSILYLNRKNGLIRDFTDDRDTLLSKYSEFRTGCPYTRAFTKTEIKEKLESFIGYHPRVWADHLVYDTKKERKIDGYREFPVDLLNIRDIDQFFYWYNQDAHCLHRSAMANEYGWHLLMEVVK
jgi:SAM-dependent methyltransferase